MKKSLIVFLFSAVVSLFLSGCTSDEGALKKQGLALAEGHFEEMLKKEAADANIQSSALRDDYVSYIKLVSKVEVEAVQLQSESSGTVTTFVKSYPVSFRKTLVSIAGSIDPSKSRGFNFGDASNLVATQKGVKTETVRQNIEVFKFSKSAEGWKLSN